MERQAGAGSQEGSLAKELGSVVVGEEEGFQGFEETCTLERLVGGRKGAERRDTGEEGLSEKERCIHSVAIRRGSGNQRNESHWGM